MHSDRAFIIAEAGVNHNGSLDLAKKLIDVAVEAKADAVKFQTFIPEEVILKNTPKCGYQIENTGNQESQFDLIKNLHLPYEKKVELFEFGKKRGICVLSTPFDLPSVDFLHGLNVPMIKIASGEITNYPLLLKAAATKRPLILSSGMATIADIEKALEVICFGYLNGMNDWPTRREIREAYLSKEGRQALLEKVTLLHCTTNYPALPEQLNLNAMEMMSKTFGLKVGYSDHSEGILASCIAVAKGAKVIEKHFTLDKNLPGPDHKASLDPSELTSLVREIRNTEKMLGHGLKRPEAIEIETSYLVRRSIVAKKSIQAGQIFSLENVTLKRPEAGMPGEALWDVIGKSANRNFQADDYIQL